MLIGKDNLTANGIQLPDVEGAIVSGTATGDWTLSCVRGDVQSITFVFSDGTVRTVPSPAKSTDGSDNKNRSGGSIGWLSDEHGVPCLAGERKSMPPPIYRPCLPCPARRQRRKQWRKGK